MSTYLAQSARDVGDRVLPLEREPCLSLVQAVLSWSPPETTLQPRDYEQIALQLAVQARGLAEKLRRLCVGLPKDSSTRALSEIVLGEAERRLSAPPRATVARVQNLARLVRALHERLDRLDAPADPGSAALSPC